MKERPAGEANCCGKNPSAGRTSSKNLLGVGQSKPHSAQAAQQGLDLLASNQIAALVAVLRLEVPQHVFRRTCADDGAGGPSARATAAASASKHVPQSGNASKPAPIMAIVIRTHASNPTLRYGR